MVPSTVLGAKILEVVETKQSRELSAEGQREFYERFYSNVASDIEEIRESQRRAYFVSYPRYRIKY